MRAAGAAGLAALAIGLVLPAGAARATPAPGAWAAGIAAPAWFTRAATDSAPPQEGGVIEIGPGGLMPSPAAAPGGETPAARRAAAQRKHSEFDEPRWVMARSLVVPGWGQLHNGSWVKAIGIATGEGVLIARMVDDNQALDDLNRQLEAARAAGDPVAEAVAVEAYNSKLNDLTRRQWLFAAVLIYSLLDAYIDAHFRDFDIEFRQDPALPGGVPPDGKPTKRSSAHEIRLALRRSF